MRTGGVRTATTTTVTATVTTLTTAAHAAVSVRMGIIRGWVGSEEGSTSSRADRHNVGLFIFDDERQIDGCDEGITK